MKKLISHWIMARVFGLIAATLFSFSLNAQTVSDGYVYTYAPQNGAVPTFPTRLESCLHYATTQSGVFGHHITPAGTPYPGAGHCGWYYNQFPTFLYITPLTAVVAPSCPAGHYWLPDGSCVSELPPADACEPLVGTTVGYSSVGVSFENVNIVPEPWALASFVGQSVTTGVPMNGNNCAASGTVTGCVLGGTTLFCELENVTYTGATYNGEQSLFGLPTFDPDKPDPLKLCPPGQYSGQINGTSVCVGASGRVYTESQTVTHPDGTTTTTETTTACVGDKCTSTTTTSGTDAQGNSTGSETSSKEGDKSTFCASNPEAPECKTAGFTGTCDSGFICASSDPIACAIAQDQHKTSCETLKRDENLGTNLAALIDDPLNALDFDTSSVSAPSGPSSSCSITAFSIPVGQASFTVDLTHMCQYLAIIRAIVTAFGFVMWTLIVFVRQ